MKKTQLVTAMGVVAGATFALSAVAADQTGNPFQADELDAGTMSAQASFGDDKEGSCGEGDDEEGSCGEGDDEGDDEGEADDEEGSCGEGDDEEGSCGEGSCGEGSCGEA